MLCIRNNFKIYSKIKRYNTLKNALVEIKLTSYIESESCSVVSDSLWSHGLYSTIPWNPPGQNTAVGSRSPLQGIFPTQGLNSGLPHCRQILYQLNHQGIKNKIEIRRRNIINRDKKVYFIIVEKLEIYLDYKCVCT